MKRFFTLLLTILFTATSLFADEGMWLPNLIGTQIKDMKSKGFKLSAEDIYSVNKASLKDGIVLFGRGCTGELVSGEGLLLTNHHCGYGQIQSHSTLANDYLTNGFWAMDRSEELPNPGLTVSFLVRMEDVTDRVFTGYDRESSTAEERTEIIARNIKDIEKAAAEEGRYAASVEYLYYGNQAYLFVYQIYRDVRLVAAPPSAIGKFGGDTDNWMWPRHTGDFAVFRIYAAPDNSPAEYSPENVPYRPKRHFTISTKGVKEGDFTFVYGFPGTTRQYVTSDFVDYTLNHFNPEIIKLRTMRLDVIKAAQDADPEIRIMYASKAANIANGWKKWQGESLGLERLGTLEKKREYEAGFMQWAADRPYYRNALADLHVAYDSLLPYAMARSYYMDAIASIEITKPVTAAIGKTASEEYYRGFYKDYSPAIDRTIAKLMIAEYVGYVDPRFIPDGFRAAVDSLGVDAYVDNLFDGSLFSSLEGYLSLAAAPDDSTYNAILHADPAYGIVSEFSAMYREKILGKFLRYNNEIEHLYQAYMRGQMEYGKGRNFYPDANLTLRVAYGSVDGYQAADGVWHRYYTTIDGIMEKDNPAIYDYDVPEKLRALYRDRDYGRWGVNTGTRREPHVTIPVAFLATNHTTGGNSGSPVLNGKGELLGINFDRTWLSTMSDLEFDPEICRNISVDIRYVLFVIDKVGGAGYLLDEMTIK